MSLTSALSIAQSALANTAAQSAIVSNNIANVSNTDYSRRSASTITQSYGGVTQGETQRATSKALLASLLAAQSASSSQSALSDGLTSLASTLGLDTTSSTDSTAATDTSPATAIGALTTALQQYAAEPDSSALGAAVVQAAKALATNLNSAAANVATVRAQADSDMAASVTTINGLLSQFKTANDAVVAGTVSGADTTTAADTRDSILKQLSSQIGISTTQGSNGSMSIYTDSGVTLFETSPRTVSFTPTTTYTSGTVGQAVSVDGIPVTGTSAVMPISGGALAGLANLRDQASVSYGNQLDQIASGLVSSFSESATSASGDPTLAGLFTNAGSSTLPTSATGLAASITVNTRVDPSDGGDVTRLRDGNVSNDDSAYTSNTTGAGVLFGSPRCAFDRTVRLAILRCDDGWRRLRLGRRLRRVVRELDLGAAPDDLQRGDLDERGGRFGHDGALQRHGGQPRRPAVQHARHRARLPGLGAADEYGEHHVRFAHPGLQLAP